MQQLTAHSLQHCLESSSEPGVDQGEELLVQVCMDPDDVEVLDNDEEGGVMRFSSSFFCEVRISAVVCMFSNIWIP